MKHICTHTGTRTTGWQDDFPPPINFDPLCTLTSKEGGLRQHRSTKQPEFIENYLTNWKKWINLLWDYKCLHNNCNVPPKYITECSQLLGKWCGAVRSLNNKGQLPIKNYRQLERMGFIFVENTLTDWDQWIKLLRIFAVKNGHCNVPPNYITECGKYLETWCKDIKSLFNQKKLNEEQITILKNLSFSFVESSFDTNSFTPWLKLMEDYKKQYGNYKVPANYIVSNKELGKWFKKQKNLAKTLEVLPPEHIAILFKFGLVKERLPENWEEGLQLLKEYKATLFKTRIPLNYVTLLGIKLGEWFESQHYLSLKGDSHLYKHHILADLGFISSKRRLF